MAEQLEPGVEQPFLVLRILGLVGVWTLVMGAASGFFILIKLVVIVKGGLVEPMNRLGSNAKRSREACHADRKVAP